MNLRKISEIIRKQAEDLDIDVFPVSGSKNPDDNQISRTSKVEIPLIGPFNGYRDLVENYWGIDYDNGSFGKWETLPLYLLDNDNFSDQDEIITSQLGENEKEVTIKIGDKSFKVFALTADGGFISCLIAKSDVKNFCDALKGVAKIEFK